VDGPFGPLVRDVTVAIPDTGVTAVIGPSGAGKSTLLRTCNRLEAPTSGTVRYRDDDVAGLDPLHLRRRVGMVFQRPTPFPGTVLENLRVAAPELGEDDALAALARARLDAGFLHRPASELSGGEAQRVCLARTLVTGPDVLLMDEVTSSLDPHQRGALEQLARDLAAGGIPVVWVTHDLPQMRRIADTVVVMIDGRVAHAGAADDVDTRAPAVVARFLGGEATGAGHDE
jgi:putative ABC transport system ATP-binding protein